MTYVRTYVHTYFTFTYIGRHVGIYVGANKIVCLSHDYISCILSGYLLLAGKVRTMVEEDTIRTTIEKHFKRQIIPSSLFGHEEQSSLTTRDILTSLSLSQQWEQFSHLVWSHDLKRLAVLLGRAVEFDEPVLLVGETG